MKAFLPELAKIFDSTPDALYERQRQLIRLGLLKKLTRGRGPGSGVPLSADSLAVLIIALATTDNLSDTDARVKKLCNAPPLWARACPLTAAENFRGAVAAILASPEKAARIVHIGVSRQQLLGSIGYDARSGEIGLPGKSSIFEWSSKLRTEKVAISTSATVNGEAVLETTKRLLEFTSAQTDEGDKS